MKKGVAYTLEAVIAISIITVSLVFIYRFSPPVIRGDIAIMKEQGLNSLEYMEAYHDLRWLAANGDEEEIERLLGTLLPDSVNLESEICKTECNMVGVPSSVTVVSVDYYTVTHLDEYTGYKIRLWMWR